MRGVASTRGLGRGRGEPVWYTAIGCHKLEQAIRTRKMLRVGVQQAEPWYAKDLSTGTWTGVGCLLGEQIASDMDCTAAFVETTFGNAPAALQADQFDVMFVLDPTPARAFAIDFPFAPMLYYALAYMTKAGARASGRMPPCFLP